jgi:hypothetical protein
MPVRTEAPLVNVQSIASDLHQALPSPVAQEAYPDQHHSLPIHAFGNGFDCMSLLQTSAGRDPSGGLSQAGVEEHQGSGDSSLGLRDHPIVFNVVGANCKSKRGPFKDQTLRQQTAETRNQGACIECARQRIRVSSVGIAQLVT